MRTNIVMCASVSIETHVLPLQAGEGERLVRHGLSDAAAAPSTHAQRRNIPRMV
jgi:hypothetical protein